jgi:small multidrug resistance family-3 protein
MTRSLLAFAVAAVLEIAGCFAFWAWLRRTAHPSVAVLGVASLIGFAVVLTKVETPFAGRAFAAYGGIYIATSLIWLWLAEGERPRAADLFGAALAVIGALVIIRSAVKAP